MEPTSNNVNPEVKPSASANIQKGKRVFRNFLLATGCLLLVVLAVMFALRNHITTDNAQVEADVIPISTRVSGQILAVMISDNQLVKKGDVLLKIDDTDYKAKVNQATSDLLVAKAQLQSVQAQEKILIATAQGGYSSALALLDNSMASESVFQAQISSAQAAVDRADSQLKNTELELTRTTNIYASSGVSKAQLDNAQTAYDIAAATYVQAKAGLTAAQEQKRASEGMTASAKGRVVQTSSVEEQIESAKAQTALATAKIKSAEAQLELALNQLQYTTIIASGDGNVAKLSVHPGQLISAGQTMAELVPSESYVVANFKEMQIRKISVGDRVKISLDAYPNMKLFGEVESISGGTGSRFSLLPPDNASGNFVKVVQRIPVRIKWSRNLDKTHLQAGLSAKVTVYGGAPPTAK